MHPKKNTTSYLHFSKEMRPKIKADNPNATFAELSKLTGASFRALEAEEKKKYEDMAAEDKRRYNEEMKDYSAPESSSDSDDDYNRKKRKKKKKDANAPKRALSSYMYFMKQMRSKYKDENPDLTFGALGKFMGAKFRELSDEDKQEYVDLAKEDKKRYEKEMKSYVPPNDGRKKKKTKAKKAPVSSSSEEEEEDSDNESSDGGSGSDNDSSAASDASEESSSESE